jgi:hypothetical protein
MATAFHTPFSAIHRDGKIAVITQVGCQRNVLSGSGIETSSDNSKSFLTS